MRRTLRRLRREDSGFTIVEMAVVCVVLATVLALAFDVMLNVMRDTNTVSNRADTTAQIRLAIQKIERQVVSGNVLYNPSSETPPDYSMRVYTQANGLKKCVQWLVAQQADGTDQLKMRSWDPNDAASVTSWQVLARNIVNHKLAKKPFQLHGPTSAYGSRIIDVDLVAQTGSDGQPAEMSTSISGRNTLYGFDQSLCSPVPAL